MRLRIPSVDAGRLVENSSRNIRASSSRPCVGWQVFTGSMSTMDAEPMSKNALKRLRKKQAWDESKDERREKRREKRRGQKERMRSERAALIAAGADPESLRKKPAPPSVLAPVCIILDCDFESYMVERERVSLSSQVTRSYSDNRQARFRSHLWVAGFGGAMEQRFRDVLGGQHRAWKGVGFCGGDFLETARRARERMAATQHEGVVEALQGTTAPDSAAEKESVDEGYRDVVYLTSDSPHTLERLEANTCYVVGGLVDKNREKGLCYRRAREKGIRTARLPIGQFMVMQSRQVLATNHVVEIMLKWLEFGDWGQAFLSVIPKRKGGRLKGAEPDDDGNEDDDGGDGDEVQTLEVQPHREQSHEEQPHQEKDGEERGSKQGEAMAS